MCVPETWLVCALCLQRAQSFHATVEASRLVLSRLSFAHCCDLQLRFTSCCFDAECPTLVSSPRSAPHLLRGWGKWKSGSVPPVKLLTQSNWWECAWRFRTGSSLCKYPDDVQSVVTTLCTVLSLTTPSPHRAPGIITQKYYWWFLHTFLLIIWFSRCPYWITLCPCFVFFCGSLQTKLDILPKGSFCLFYQCNFLFIFKGIHIEKLWQHLVPAPSIK